MLLECDQFSETFHKMSQDALLLDVRSEEEISHGYLPGAIFIPINEIMDRYSELSKDKVIFIYCRSGGRAQMAQEFLSAKGYKTYVAVHCGYDQLKNKIM